jgi:hypothetical protein
VIAGNEFDPDEATNQIGLEPTRIWFQTDRLLLLEKELPKVEWSIGGKKRNFDEVEEAVQQVLEAIWPAREKIRSYVRLNGLRSAFICAVFIYTEPPMYCLSAESMRRMASFQAEFSMVIYDYRDD